MKNRSLWILYFFICLGLGFLHGILPRGITNQNLIAPTKFEIIATDEIFVPEETRQKLEKEFNIKISLTVTRNWDALLAQLVASPGPDLLFLPSFWAHSLTKQNLLSDVSGKRQSLQQKVAPDFIDIKSGYLQSSLFYFLPFYWIKTTLHTATENQSFLDYLNDKKQTDLFLLSDEDLLLKHFQTWQAQNILTLVAQKKILTRPLDQLEKDVPTLGAAETSLQKISPDTVYPFLSALLIWGAAIPQNSENKALAADILETLTSNHYQEDSLLKTAFNSTLKTLDSDKIPLQRRAGFIRDLKFNELLIIEGKDPDAKFKLKNEFNLAL